MNLVSESKDEAEPEYLSIGQITADLTNYQVTVDDHLIELTPKEFELLVYFMKRKDRVIDRDTLLDRIWNFDFAGQSRIVDVHVSHLREKIERDPKHPKYLVTVVDLAIVSGTKTMKWKKIYERLFFLILLVSLFFGGWQLISNYFQQQIVEQQESYLTKKHNC